MDTFTSAVAIVVVLVNPVSAQLRVWGLTGQDVLLPCVYSGSKPLKSITVFWRGRDDRHVYDILNNVPDFSGQDSRFRDRTDSFPNEYSKGNFSILLRKVKVQDSGRYDCFIPALDFQHNTELNVTDKRVEPGRESDSSTPGGSAGITLHLLTVLLGILLSLNVLL
ncbi:CD276 antigen homolog isoform 1-T2 [Polymixia lowei]